MPPRALPPLLPPRLPGALPAVLAVVLVPPLALTALDRAEELLGPLCTTTVVDRHLGTGPTCLDPTLDLDGARRLVALWRGH